MKTRILLTIVIVILSFGLFAATHTVNSSMTTPVIQGIITTASAGDIIEFEDGTYNLTACINISNGVTLISQNGADATIIDGTNAIISLSNSATRCFFINNANAVVDGFTVQNAHGSGTDKNGGGVRIDNEGTIQNCKIKDNYGQDGGGVAINTTGGFVLQCEIFNNTASYGGGIRMFGGEVRNCLIYDNTASSNGGGINIYLGPSLVYNCTVTNNHCNTGGGIRIFSNSNAEIGNCIIYNNTNSNLYDANPSNSNIFNNYTNDPSFVGATDFHLQSSSASIDVGQNDAWMTATFDLDGNDRILNGTVDIGCYEFIPPPDDDNDGVINSADLCDNTPNGEAVDVNGCSDSQKDTDNDGVVDSEDNCMNTPNGDIVDEHGCTIVIIDTDGDGAADVDDDFPNNPDLAFKNKFPSHGYGSLGFEDLWPGKGDYDFNDVVVDYKFTSFSNANNKVVYITAKFIFKASGAYLQNGFGFNLPTGLRSLRGDLTVTGSDIQESYIDLKSNGMERGQDRPTIIVCDNVFNLLEHPGSGTGVNTEEWAPFVPFETVTLTMTPTPDAYVWEDFGLTADEWNPFIIVDMERGREVHLKDRLPTSLADLSLLGTAEDDSKPEEDRYYTTVNNLPWAISVTDFDWPRERIEINWAYKYFIEWAESSGTVRQNWYRDRPGFRTESNIYQLPNP